MAAGSRSSLFVPGGWTRKIMTIGTRSTQAGSWRGTQDMGGPGPLHRYARDRQEAHGRRRKLMVNDMARACFNAPSLLPMFLEICGEDFEAGCEGRCGELRVSMCGQGRRRRTASTCIFRHAGRDIDTIVHRDDFVSAAGSGNGVRVYPRASSKLPRPSIVTTKMIPSRLHLSTA